MAAENRFVLISFNGYLFDNLKLMSYSYELQAKSDKLPFPLSMFIDTS